MSLENTLNDWGLINTTGVSRENQYIWHMTPDEKKTEELRKRLDPEGNTLKMPDIKQEGEYKIDTASFSQALNEYYKQAEKHQQKVWEREDTALQRASADARKAGIDPNLVGLEGAGTTSTYGSALETGLNANYESLLSQMKNEFTKEFEGSENSKDRDTKIDAAMLMGIFNLLAIFMKK